MAIEAVKTSTTNPWRQETQVVGPGGFYYDHDSVDKRLVVARSIPVPILAAHQARFFQHGAYMHVEEGFRKDPRTMPVEAVLNYLLNNGDKMRILPWLSEAVPFHFEDGEPATLTLYHRIDQRHIPLTTAWQREVS